ncbi:hypothetical protein D3C81_2072730 [compost metagenome]
MRATDSVDRKGPPLVRDMLRSNILKAQEMARNRQTVTAGITRGSIMLFKVSQAVAPSIRAASSSSEGILTRAAM